ncbi:hypothetical protein LSO9J_30024 [Candidatus Liberibacter solanacearum]
MSDNKHGICFGIYGIISTLQIIADALHSSTSLRNLREKIQETSPCDARITGESEKTNLLPKSPSERDAPILSANFMRDIPLWDEKKLNLCT